MDQKSLTYHLISAALIFLVFAGATLPSGLHKKDMMMDMCEEMDTHTMPQDDCDLGFACACSISEAPVKTESKISVAPVKIKATFTGSVIAPLKEEYKPSCHCLHIASTLADASPPLFLKNSSFLN